VVLTGDELRGLMAGLLTSRQPPVAPTRFSEWLEQNATTVGRRHSSEIARHYYADSAGDSSSPKFCDRTITLTRHA
jgi:hypothetical protein